MDSVLTRANILSRIIPRIVIALSLFMVATACAVTKAPVNEVSAGDPVPGVSSECENPEICGDGLVNKYQYYLGLLSTILIR